MILFFFYIFFPALKLTAVTSKLYHSSVSIWERSRGESQAQICLLLPFFRNPFEKGLFPGSQTDRSAPSSSWEPHLLISALNYGNFNEINKWRMQWHVPAGCGSLAALGRNTAYRGEHKKISSVTAIQACPLRLRALAVHVNRGHHHEAVMYGHRSKVGLFELKARVIMPSKTRPTEDWWPPQLYMLIANFKCGILKTSDHMM